MHDSIWERGSNAMMIVLVYNLRPNGQHFTLLRGGRGGENQIAILAKDEHRMGGIFEFYLHCSTFFNII